MSTYPQQVYLAERYAAAPRSCKVCGAEYGGRGYAAHAKTEEHVTLLERRRYVRDQLPSLVELARNPENPGVLVTRDEAAVAKREGRKSVLRVFSNQTSPMAEYEVERLTGERRSMTVFELAERLTKEASNVLESEQASPG